MPNLRRLLPALLVSALAPGSGWAEMTPVDRDAFRAEVRAYLLENPEILSEMVAILEDRQRVETVARDAALIAEAGPALFDDGFSFVGGNPEGSLTIVEFLDYQCGYCRRAHPEFAALVAADGDIRWVVKELPILGPASELASRAAIATLLTAGPEAYARLNDGLLRLDGPVTETSVAAAIREAGADPAAVLARLDDPEVTRRIEATRALAAELEIQGTPTFVFADRMLRGYAPQAAMQALVADIRAGG